MIIRKKLCNYDCCNIIDIKYRVCPCELGECPKCNEELIRTMDEMGESVSDDFYNFEDEPNGPDAA